MPPLVSVVLGSYNRQPYLKSAVDSIRHNLGSIPAEIIVIDGGSSDGSLKYLFSQKDILTIVQHNHGNFKGKPLVRRSWGYFMNLGFKAAQGKYILMISDDCLLIPNSLQKGVDYFEERLQSGEKVGATAFYYRNWPEEKEYYVYLTMGMKLMVNHGLFLRKALEDVGWIDEDLYQFYYADCDLSLKLWDSGYSVVDCKTAFVEHFSHLKSDRKSEKMDWDPFFKRWKHFATDENSIRGGKKFLSFTDPDETVKKFPSSAVLRYKTSILRRKIKSITSTFIKRVKHRLYS